MRTAAVSCLGQCVATYLRRFAKAVPPADLAKWLKRALGGVLGQLRKGGFPLTEQQVPPPLLRVRARVRQAQLAGEVTFDVITGGHRLNLALQKCSAAPLHTQPASTFTAPHQVRLSVIHTVIAAITVCYRTE